MNVFEFMTNSPFLTFFSIYVVAHCSVNLVNRILRHINIRKHGYPPVHCDADGDFLDTEKR